MAGTDGWARSASGEDGRQGGSRWIPRLRGSRRQLLTILAGVLLAVLLFDGSALAAKTKAPKITRQPTGMVVEEGRSAVFEAAASGTPTPTVQWEVSTNAGGTWSPLGGAVADQLTIADANIAESGREYRAVFTNVGGKATSAAATLTVQDTRAPAVTKQPVDATVEEGQSAVFEATASGLPAPTVQWEVSTNAGVSWSPVAGGTSQELTIADTGTSENGDEYRAVFSNTAGQATSEAVTLSVASKRFDAVAWGSNAFGQLGDGTLEQRSAPVPVSDLSFVTAVAAGRRFSLALLSNGTVAAWGADASGELGDEEINGSSVPVAVEHLTGVKAIAAGDSYALALLANGTVMAWGENESGQLGNGTTNEAEVPVAVKGLTGVTAIAAGGSHSLALLANGTVMAWGEGEHGQLGDGKTDQSNVPVAVKGVTGASAIAAGAEHSLALLAGGTVMAWGSNEFGQLGTGAAEESDEEQPISSVPAPVNGLSAVTALAAGSRHNLALLDDGTVMAWGEDESGELGDGSIGPSQEAPVPVLGLAGVTAVAAGGEHSMALLGDGTVMTWGEGKRGELGNGSSGNPSDVPVAVPGLAEVAGIGAGGLHDLAFGEPLPAVTAVSPANGSTAGGSEVTITGIDLDEASAVRFGAKTATSFTVDSASSISAVAPAGVAGTVDVTVTTPAGTSSRSAGDRFNYQAAPTVSKLSAKGGAGAGGTTVTITGTNLAGATSVEFGSSAATFTVKSAGSITAVAPAGAGTVDVRVITPVGTSAASKHDRFAYAPSVEGVTPDLGPSAGGTAVTITGAGFSTEATVTSFKFGTKKATHVICVSSTTCTATAPAHAVGGVDVIATVGKAKSPANPGDRFNYG